METAALKQFGMLFPHVYIYVPQLTPVFLPEAENQITLVDPSKDGLYSYDEAEQKYSSHPVSLPPLHC
jgi:hypothetical protein